jgi:aminoglycoside phosphotransferase (APT) family kinase protein
MPQWAALSRHPVESLGTDNVIIRLGGKLAVRLPRTSQAAAALTKEQRFLPLLTLHLPLEIPAPVAFGEPDDTYPWPWSVCPWIAGRNPEPGEADIALAGDLADFVRTLHEIDTFGLRSEGPLHSYRADSIRLRNVITQQSIEECEGLFDRTQLANIWDHAKRAEDFAGQPVWAHSDLHPGNLLVRSGKLAAVIDWGSLILGDPAIDCIVAWTLLTPETRSTFRTRVGVDDDTWRRGRAWALSIALVALPYYIHTNQQITAWARYTIRQVATDVSSSTLAC